MNLPYKAMEGLEELHYPFLRCFGHEVIVFRRMEVSLDNLSDACVAIFALSLGMVDERLSNNGSYYLSSNLVKQCEMTSKKNHIICKLGRIIDSFCHIIYTENMPHNFPFFSTPYQKA